MSKMLDGECARRATDLWQSVESGLEAALAFARCQLRAAQQREETGQPAAANENNEATTRALRVLLDLCRQPPEYAKNEDDEAATRALEVALQKLDKQQGQLSVIPLAISNDAELGQPRANPAPNIERYSFSATDTMVQFNAQIETGCMCDAATLRDRLREIPALGAALEKLVLWLTGVTHLGWVLYPFWGPLALMGMTGWGLSDGTELWSWIFVVFMGIHASASTLILLHSCLNWHSGMVRLLLRQAKFVLTVEIGTRLVYTGAAISYFPHPANVLHLVSWMILIIYLCFSDAINVTNMMRFSRDAYKQMNDDSRASCLPRITNVFSFAFEVARHISVLHAMDAEIQSTATRTVKLLPVDVRASQLDEPLLSGIPVTNVDLMNVSFCTSMFLYLLYFRVRFSTGGKQFLMITSSVNFHPIYVESDADGSNDAQDSSVNASTTTLDKVTIAPMTDTIASI